MLTHALEHAPAADRHDDDREPSHGGRSPAGFPAPGAEAGGTWRGLLALLAVGTALVAACGVLGTRTWQVGSGLGAALFPVEDVVELAAVAVGTAVAGWTGAHALLALACVLAGRRGTRWAAAERTVARHAPAVVRRLARAAAGAGLGLALTAPTAMALPESVGVPAADAGPAVVLDLGWRATSTVSGEPTGRPGPSVASDAEPAPERASLVDQGRRAGAGREPVVVEAGDTLWAIAADDLAADLPSDGGGPSNAEIAETVDRWHEANRQVLGTDPDLIRPGTVLHQP